MPAPRFALPLCTVAFAVAASTTAAAEPPGGRLQEDTSHPLYRSMISVRVVGGFSPYQSVFYEVVWRARTPVAVHYRSLVNYEDHLHRLSLVPRADYEKLLGEVERMGMRELRDAPAARMRLGALRWEIEFARGGKRSRVTVDAPHAQPDGRYAAIIDRVRAFVLEHAGDLSFRNVFFEPGTFGYLNLTSVPAARVRIDGRDSGLETPMYGYELKAGLHEVELVSDKHKLRRKHTLRIEPGMTTIVHLDLR